jgi:hypothetical protein
MSVVLGSKHLFHCPRYQIRSDVRYEFSLHHNKKLESRQLSRLIKRTLAEQPGFPLPAGDGQFYFSKMPWPTLDPTEPSIQWVQDVPRERSSSLLLSAEFENEWSYNSIVPYAFKACTRHLPHLLPIKHTSPPYLKSCIFVML